MKCITIFRNRLRPGDHEREYDETLARMIAIAEGMPGYLGRKTFVAEDGERATLVEFESLEQAHAWGRHPEHRVAQRRGREVFYDTFVVQNCEVREERTFIRGQESTP